MWKNKITEIIHNHYCGSINSESTRNLARVMTLETLIAADKYKRIFYGKKNFDQETVAYSIVVVNEHRDDEYREEFKTISSSGHGHAEDSFLTKVQLRLIQQFQQGEIKDIKITSMLSKSPCWKCRENLEAYFESLGVRVKFILRIANLYHGDYDGGKEAITDNLAFWFHHLLTNGIVSACSDIQPISVTTELHDYSPRRTRINIDWNDTVKRREKTDKKISETVEDIKMKIEDYLEPMPSLSITDLANIRSKLMAKVKRLFYKSTSTNRNTQIFVAIAQVQLFASNTVRRTKEKEFQAIVERTDTAGCCHLDFDGLLRELLSNEDEYKAPASWTRVSRKILLALTHFPCGNCVTKITTVIREITPRLLVLRVANINLNERASIVNWLYERYRKGLKVRLEAISVKKELGTVRRATEDDKDEWETAKTERLALDSRIIKRVRCIDTKLSDKKFEGEAERLRKIKIN